VQEAKRTETRPDDREGAREHRHGRSHPGGHGKDGHRHRAIHLRRLEIALTDADAADVQTRQACTYPSPARGLVCDRHHGHRDHCRATVKTPRGTFTIEWRPAAQEFKQ
jgi:hypothetical protein